MTVAIIAHGGSSRDHPANSWAAFDAARADGADRIECDIQTTADDVLIVRHDLTADGARVSEQTLASLRAIEPGLVLFDDLLGWCREQGLGVLAELKDRQSAGGVAGLVPRHDHRDVRVGSYNGPLLLDLKNGVDRITTSLMVGTVMGAGEMAYLAGRYGCAGVHPCWENRDPYPHALLERDTVAALQSNNLEVTLWHEEREDELEKLITLKPNGICTDTPKVLRRMLDGAAGAGGS